jgi:hypothetical protein
MKTRMQTIDERMRRLEKSYKILAAQRKLEQVKARLANKGGTASA